MRRTSLFIGLVGLLAWTPLLAQDPSGEPPRIEQLRRMIEERFADRLEADLGLTGEQATRVRTILSTWAAKRRVLEREERRLRQDLMGQLRPGVAADEALVSRTVDAMLDGRMAYVQSFKDELKDLTTVLNPIQRAQYLLLRDRLNQRVEEIRNQRQGGPAFRQRGIP